MGLTLGQAWNQRGNPNGRYSEKRFNFISNQGNANRNPNEVTLHMRQAKTKNAENTNCRQVFGAAETLGKVVTC